MNWRFFVEHLQKLGYDGNTDNFEEVTSWLKANGHNAVIVQAKGQQYQLKELFDSRPGKTLDVTPAAELAEWDAAVEREAERKLAELNRLTGIGRPSTPHTHDVKVGKDRIEDDPCLGYPEFDNLGFGLLLQDVYKHASCVREGRVDEIPARFSKAQRILEKAPSGLNEAVDSEGGALVPLQHQNELLRKTYDVGQVFPRARQIAMTSKQLEIPYIVESSRADGSRHGGVRGYWGAEAGELQTSQPAFGKLNLVAHKLHAYGFVTTELEEDSSPAALQVLAELFSEELAFKMDDAFIRGTGVGQPLGILNAPCLISESRAAAGEVRGDDVSEMWSQLYFRGRQNAVWFANQEIDPWLARLSVATNTAGTNTSVLAWLPFDRGLAGGPGTPMLYGRPLIYIEQAGAMGALGDLMLCDMTQYLHGMRRGITSQQSIHIRFDFDEIAFKVTMRADGQPWWQSALTPFQQTSLTVSPFVALAA